MEFLHLHDAFPSPWVPQRKNAGPIGLGMGNVVGFRQAAHLMNGVRMNAGVPEPSLTALMHLLTEQALLALGVPHPHMSQQPPANPAVARFYIDLLGILKDKTEGHRSAEESLAMDELLHELKMRLLNLQPATSMKP
ncbi:MAG TPA: DUF1844 domain-containing protein [Geothrix sp.]|nr:DUF1844 domain-containing protein [Geothrix sp.]